MTASWSIWLLDPAGNQLAILDQIESAEIIRVVNGSGWFEINLSGNVDENTLAIDSIIEFWRKPEGGNRQRILVGFIRKRVFWTDSSGVSRVQISGPDVNELFLRRIVAYTAGSSGASKTDQADDMVKAIAKENLGASASDPDRDLTAAGFSVADDEADGPSLTLSFSFVDVVQVIQDLVDAATGDGTPIYWDIVPQGGSSFKLFTYTGQPGTDRTNIQDPVTFGLEWGNLSEPVQEEDYTEEITCVYGGGQQEGSNRNVVEVEDATRIARSPWNRREAFVDARNEETTAGVTDRANACLIAGKPKLRFSGNLLDTPQARYGIDWSFGDRVIITYRKRQYNALVNTVSIAIDGTSNETIKAEVEIEDVL